MIKTPETCPICGKPLKEIKELEGSTMKQAIFECKTTVWLNGLYEGQLTKGFFCKGSPVTFC